MSEEERKQEQEETGVVLPTTQSELDAMINKSNQKAIKNAQKGLYTEEQLQEELDKLKVEYEQPEEDEELSEVDELKKQLETERSEHKRNNLISELKRDLVDRELPVEVDGFDFTEFFLIEDDPEKTHQAVKAFDKAYKQSLVNLKKELYKQSTPRDGVNKPSEVKSLGATLGEKNKSRNQKIFNK